MKTRARHVDALFHFGPPDRPSCCRLRVFLLGPDRPALVIATGLPGPGVSIANAVEDLAGAVARLHGIDPDCMLFVEHAMPSALGPEQFSAVSFERGPSACLLRPSWRPIALGSVEHLAGVSLRD